MWVKLLDSLHIGHYWEVLHNFLTIGFNKRGGHFETHCFEGDYVYAYISGRSCVDWTKESGHLVLFNEKWTNCCCMMATVIVSYADFFKTIIMFMVKKFQIWLQTFYIQKLTLDKCLT